GATAWEHIAKQTLKTPDFVPRPTQRPAAAIVRPFNGNTAPERPTAPETIAGQGADTPEQDVEQDEPCGQWSELRTERELDVARQPAQGRTNRPVAANLYVSVRTVEGHLGRVFRKLGVRSRTELAVLALRG